MRKTLPFLMLMVVLLACSFPALPLRAPTETPTATRLKVRRATRTPVPSPSATLAPTQPVLPPASVTPEAPLQPTPALSPSPSALPTKAALSASPVPSPGGESGLSCQLMWQSPGSGIAYKAKQKFATGWNIKNTGTVTWSPGTVEFVYLGGAKLHNDEVVPLTGSVAPGQAVTLSVAMVAPVNPTMYTTYWGLRSGNVYFCRVEVSIVVQ